MTSAIVLTLALGCDLTKSGRYGLQGLRHWGLLRPLDFGAKLTVQVEPLPALDGVECT